VESRKTSIAVEDRFKVVPFEEFCEIAHIGHSRGYEFLNSGDVKSVLVGRRRLVFIQSWYDYLERLLEEQRTFTPGRHPASRQSPPSEPADPPPAQASPPPRRRGRPRKYPRPADTDDPAPAAANQRWAEAIFIGLCNGSKVTAVPRRMRLVRWAAAASTISGSASIENSRIK